MKLGRSGSQQESPAAGGGTNAVRGGLVVGLALVVGFFLFSQIDTVSTTAVSADAGIDGDASVDPASGEPTDDTGLTGEAASGDAMGDDAMGDGTSDSTGDGSSLAGTDTTGDATGDDAMADQGSGSSMEDEAMEDGSGSAMADDTDLVDPADLTVIVLNGAEEAGIAAKGTEVAEAAGYDTMVAKNADGTQASAIYYLEGFEAEALALADVYGPELQSLVEPLDEANPPSDEIAGADLIVVLGVDGLIDVS